MEYEIVSTGSCGNAVIVNDIILIDCGVSFKALHNHYKKLKLVLLTHIHTDHYKKTTIRKLSSERPTLRFACCEWLVGDLIGCGVTKKNIDVLEIGKKYAYNGFKVAPIKLYHNVSNCGYRLYFGEEKAIYATDTNTLDGISAIGYDLYMIECNYEDEEIQERIKRKQEQGEYAYEVQALNNHLSKAKCDDFIYQNIRQNGKYVYLHRHIEKEEI